MFILSRLVGFAVAALASTVKTVAPSRIGTDTFKNSTGLTSTHSHTVPAGTDILIVDVNANVAATAVVSSVTFGGAALTQAVRVTQAGTEPSITEIWYKTGPTPSTANIVVTLDTSATDIGARGTNYQNATGIGDTASNSSTSASTLSATITTTDVFSFVHGTHFSSKGGTDNILWTSPLARIYQVSLGATKVSGGGVARSTPPAESVTVEITQGGGAGQHAIAAIEITGV